MLCWDKELPSDQVSEIIEIGLTVVDLRAGERMAKHRILVRPALSFREACRTLAARHRSAELPWASWGDYDRDQFTRQCRDTGVEYPFADQHTNAKVAFTAARGLRRRLGMAQALALAGLPLEGRHHRGDDDAWNIAALVLDLVRRGAWPRG